MHGNRLCVGRHLDIGRPGGRGVAGRQRGSHPQNRHDAYRYSCPHELNTFPLGDQSILTETDFFFASSVFGIRTSSTPSLKFALIWSLLTSLGNSTLRTNEPYDRSLR